MVKLIIGLYKHRETGQFDVMINQRDNTFTCRNGEFDLVKEFSYKEKTKEEKLREECQDLQDDLSNQVRELLIPVFTQGKSSDYLDDKQINLVRETLYNFMCKRRELFVVNEYIRN